MFVISKPPLPSNSALKSKVSLGGDYESYSYSQLSDGQINFVFKEFVGYFFSNVMEISI